ncbi:phenylalanine--tRNA ligase subunit alpha [Candidatus Parcubacteria bacterium]|nr:phenylalanine--tRNA ligase subunit alpha [Patescibacteria group bacterium]MBU4380891.1 phenylalanine--tRNA ligase subunit alpha [Patescibacteria group bacterium]MCG2688942.1 phenylalanine--tRNA ligase subunit alpha [Candidatus Parcubacteria bacterium]
MLPKLLKIKEDFDKDSKNCLVVADIEVLDNKYLGRSGVLKKVTSSLLNLTPKEKKSFGIQFNELKGYLEDKVKEKKKTFLQSSSSSFDYTIPSIKLQLGSTNILTQTIEEITSIFKFLGYTRKRYPEVDTEYHAFESLNMPKQHPARDEWETFFVEGEGNLVLTPHTSNAQVREMESQEPPIRLLNIAKCYRRQEDVSHTQMFHQFEGVLVDENISINNLIGTLDFFVKNYFGEKRKTRLRPYHFQFTEPSFEVDINCSVCLGKGCGVCKEGWLELGGAGMIHPSVLKYGKVDPKYNGFAFGWGVERVAMMKHNIPDCRMFYKNDLRFLNQF